MSSRIVDFSPLEHVLSPKYEILSEEEKKKLLRRCKIKPYNLPRMLSGDPAAKSLGANVGDVLKITRRSETAGESTYYRLVVIE